MQRLVLVHLNWLGKQTWISGGQEGDTVRGEKISRLTLTCIAALGTLQGHCRGSEPGLGPRRPGAVPQLASSELSWQSLSPSQMKAGLVQIPVEHWNCPGRHLNSAGGRESGTGEVVTPLAG